MASELLIRPYADSDRVAVQSLLASSRHAHIHLDWRAVSDRLSDSNLVGWIARAPGENHRPVGFLGAVQGHGGAAWLRLASFANGVGRDALNALWPPLQDTLDARGITPIGVLALNRWIEDSVRRWDFVQSNAVVTLRHRGNSEPLPLPPGLRVRDASHHDLDTIAAVDAAAFPPLWRHDQSDLQFARVAAVTFTVAELETRIVGYQLSTQHGTSGHLARLAVAPDVQKQGVGRSLISGALAFFHNQGVREVTVNTQRNNEASQRLYRRMGFRFTHQSVPVWTI